MDESKIFVYTGKGLKADLEAGFDLLAAQNGTLGLKAVDINGNSVVVIAFIINVASKPDTAKKELMNVIEATGRSGTDAIVLVGVCKLLEKYGNADFAASLTENLDTIKAVKRRLEGKVEGEAAAVTSPSTPKKSGSENGTPKTSPQAGQSPGYTVGIPQYFPEGSSWGRASIGGPAPYPPPPNPF